MRLRQCNQGRVTQRSRLSFTENSNCLWLKCLKSIKIHHLYHKEIANGKHQLDRTWAWRGAVMLDSYFISDPAFRTWNQENCIVALFILFFWFIVSWTICAISIDLVLLSHWCGFEVSLRDMFELFQARLLYICRFPLWFGRHDTALSQRNAMLSFTGKSNCFWLNISINQYTPSLSQGNCKRQTPA